MTKEEKERGILAYAAIKLAYRDTLAAQLAALDTELRGIKAQFMVATDQWGLGEEAFRREVRRMS